VSAILAGLDEAESFDFRDCDLYIGTDPLERCRAVGEIVRWPATVRIEP
jgi:hypothetical protein